MKIKGIAITPKRCAIASITLAIIIFLLITIFTLIGKAKKQPEYIISNGDLYMIKGNKSCIKITSVLAGNSEDPGAVKVLTDRIFYSANDKYIYFSDNADVNSNEITYYVARADFKKPAEKLDTRISKIIPAEKGENVLYLKDGSLILYAPGKEAAVIDTEVSDFTASANEKIISYMKTDGSLWIKNNSKSTEKLDINISELCSVTGSGVTYYKKNEILYFAKQFINKEPEINKICSGLPENCFIKSDYTSNKFYFLTYSKKDISGDVKINTYQINFYDGKKVNLLCENVDIETIKLAPDYETIAFIFATDSGSKLGIYNGKTALSKKQSATDIISFSSDSKTVFAKYNGEIVRSHF